jgi:hypothetical protein
MDPSLRYSTRRLLMDTDKVKVIDPATHAVLDYMTAATFLTMGAVMRNRHRGAATLAFINGFAVLGLAMLTRYPGGLLEVLSFKTHGMVDAVQATMSAVGPALLGFAGDKEAAMFYGQAALESGVIAATDWSAARG